MEWIVAILVSLAYWIGFFVAYFIIFKPFDLVMTKEEKAKAYEDALERTREYYNKAKESGDNSAVARYEAIFPQLRESKDERIRKGLIEALKTSKTVGELKFAIPYPEREECIAYLEKQKEQDWNKKPCLTCQEYEKGHKQGYTEGCTAGYNKAMKEMEQKEQKSIQTPDEVEYVKTLKGLVSDFVRYSGGGIADTAYYQHICDWLDGRHIEQKPVDIAPNQFDGITYGMQGYSTEKPVERDLTVFEGVLDTFLFNFAHSPIEDCEPKEYIKKYSSEILKAAYKELQSELKHDLFEAKQEGRKEGYEAGVYETEQKQQPAEWSEEDEKIITRLIGYFESFRIAGVATKWEGLDIQEVITLLKSLRNRPKSSDNWKPSEDQIKALQNAVALAAGNKVLAGLYKQLKKL